MRHRDPHYFKQHPLHADSAELTDMVQESATVMGAVRVSNMHTNFAKSPCSCTQFEHLGARYREPLAAVWHCPETA